MLLYDTVGNEIYFNSWKTAKYYIRTMPKKIDNDSNTPDNIPF